MPISQKNIVPGVALTAAAAPYYTAPALTRARICNATLTNTTGAPVAVTVHIVPSAGVPNAANQKISARPLGALETYPCPELIGRVLEPGDSIQALGLAVSFDASALIQV